MQNRPLDMCLIFRSVDKMIHEVNNQKNEHKGFTNNSSKKGRNSASKQNIKLAKNTRQIILSSQKATYNKTIMSDLDITHLPTSLLPE